MTDYYNRREEKGLRRRLRKDMPPAERILWSRLKGKQFVGRKFRRQFSVGPYCLDFYCPEIRLAIELDGDSHFTDAAGPRDRARQEWVESFAIRFLRFTNTDVYENLDGVLAAIAAAVEDTPLDPPFARGEEIQPSPLQRGSRRGFLKSPGHSIGTPLDPPFARGEGINAGARPTDDGSCCLDPPFAQ